MSWGWQPETVTRIRPQYFDDGHGNQVVRVVDGVPVGQQAPIPGCLWAPAAPAEVLGGRETVKLAGTIYGPDGADIRPRDAIQRAGQVYRVVGDPQVWRPGIVVDVETWAG